MNPKIRAWRGRRVWLVGASAGIGAALAHALAQRGARLALSARGIEQLQALQIDGALLLPCDSTDAASLAAARQALIEAWGGVDLVVYLAGDYVPMRADSLDLATIERVVEVNFNGALRLVATALAIVCEGVDHAECVVRGPGLRVELDRPFERRARFRQTLD